MSVQISLGTKKKSYPSIKAAAKVVADATGEPLMRVYMRMYMRHRKLGWKGVTAVKAKPRKYQRKIVVETQQPLAA